MENKYDVIVKPLVTEKTVKANEEANTVVFEVAAKANKTEVKQAVEEIFKVKVEKVNIVNVKPKTKRYGRYVGKTNSVRKTKELVEWDNIISLQIKSKKLM